MPYIVKKNTAVPDGVAQIKDLWPNRSQANAVIDPKPYGIRYLNGPQNIALTSTVANGTSFSLSCSGLASYIITNISANGGFASSVSNANRYANGIISNCLMGVEMTVNTLNFLDDLNVFDNITNDQQQDILSILAGAIYTVPAGHIYANGDGDLINRPGSTGFVINESKLFDSSFYISNARGDISVMKSDSFVYLNNAVTPPVSATGALIIVYNDDGTINE